MPEATSPSFGFAPPSTVTPGEYLVTIHKYYRPTPLNKSWDRAFTATGHLRNYASDQYSDASSRASRSPSPFSSRASSEDTASSTPPPVCDSGELEAPSGPRRSYRRFSAAESRLTSQALARQKRKRREDDGSDGEESGSDWRARKLVKAGSLPCDQCPKMFKASALLDRHKHRVHRHGLTSNDCAMSTPSPEGDPPEASVESVTPDATTFGRRKSSKRLAAAKSQAASQRSVTQKRKRGTASAGPGPARSVVCQWAGCREHVANGRQLWDHIEAVHKPLGSDDDTDGGRQDGEEDIYQDDSEQTGHVCSDDDDDHDDDEVEEDSSDSESDSDSDSGSDYGKASKSSSKPRRTVMKSQRHITDRYQTRVRCQWKRCKTTIQFAGLRRHIESKHSIIRNTSCPRGCGYVTNRPDMMPRHTVKCHYRGPKRGAKTEG